MTATLDAPARSYVVSGLSAATEIPSRVIPAEVWREWPSLVGVDRSDVPVGAVLVVREDRPSGATLRPGEPVEVVDPEGRGGSFLAVRSLLPDAPDPLERISRSFWAVDPADVSAYVPGALEPEDPAAEVVRLRADVERQAREIRRLADRLDGERTEAARLRERHLADLRSIGSALRREADERSWCSEYDQAATEVANGLHEAEAFRQAAVRLKTYRVVVEVEAYDEDSAREAAEETHSNYGFSYADVEEREGY